MSDQLVLFAAEGGVAEITINRPKSLNALDLATLAALESAVNRAEEDPAVRVLIFTGAGSKAFVAGGDISDLNSRQGLPHYLEYAERIHTVFRRIELCSKPTIGAVNGWALGGGTELLLCLDIRLLAESARIGLPEITLGLFPGAGGSQRLMRQVANCVARELMFVGSPITAQDAVRVGLANKVLPDGDLMTAAKGMAREIAKKSPLVLRLLKRTLQDGAEMPLSASLRHEQAMIGLVLDSKDAHEGCTAFLEKRPPVFEGR